VNHLSSYFPDPKGSRLHYQYWEDSSKGYDRVALLLHGLGCHSGSYAALVPAFVAARYKVIAPDFAGFGMSPGERGSGGVLAMADAIEALYRRIESAEGAREIEIVAHSMGAIAAFLFLKRYPARRTRLAAMSPLFFGVPVDITPEVLAGDESRRAGIASDPRYAASIPNALATDLDLRVPIDALAPVRRRGDDGVDLRQRRNHIPGVSADDLVRLPLPEHSGEG